MKLTLKQLTNIIESYRDAKNIHEKPNFPNIDTTLFSLNLERIINIMFVLYFGENNTDLVYNFILDNEDNKFETIEELYEYLSDKYSEIVRKDSALTIDQLRQLFPEEEMFKFFKKTIEKYVSNNP